MCAVCGPSSKENRQGTTLQEYSHHYWQYARQYTAAAAAAASPIPAPAISTVRQVRGEGGADKSVATYIIWTGILFKSTRLYYYYCTGPMVSHICEFYYNIIVILLYNAANSDRWMPCLHTANTLLLQGYYTWCGCRSKHGTLFGL